MVSKEVTIKNRAGIHARPAALIVQTANEYDCDVHMEKDGNRVNAKSIMGIITLGASYEAVLTIICDGADEDDALNSLATLFENKFSED
jgi:phosphocarrier protein HPr